MNNKWHSIVYELRNNRGGLSALFTRDEIRSRVQFFAVYIIFFLVGLGMTVMNLITGWYGLAITTAVFSFVNLVNIICATANEKLEKIAEWVFAVEITALFVVFIINGEPEGFSAIWALIMPASGLILYGRKNGSIISIALLAIIMVLFWTPFGRSLLLFDYTTSFLNRFPMIYIALFAVDFFFETVRHMTQKELTSTRNEFRFQASHDILTGLMNRMGFNSRIDEFLDSDPDGFAFALADLDFFKRINDTYGHNCGDIVLKDFANTSNGIIGNRGFMCRWGGEEFAFLIYDPDLAEKLCDKIRRKIEQSVHTFDGKSCRHTVSFGISIAVNSGEIPISEIIKTADDNLYKSKETGRNKISCSKVILPADDKTNR